MVMSELYGHLILRYCNFYFCATFVGLHSCWHTALHLKTWGRSTKLKCLLAVTRFQPYPDWSAMTLRFLWRHTAVKNGRLVMSSVQLFLRCRRPSEELLTNGKKAILQRFGKTSVDRWAFSPLILKFGWLQEIKTFLKFMFWLSVPSIFSAIKNFGKQRLLNAYFSVLIFAIIQKSFKSRYIQLKHFFIRCDPVEQLRVICYVHDRYL